MLFHTHPLERPLCIWIFPANGLKTGHYTYLLNKGTIVTASENTGKGSSQKVTQLDTKGQEGDSGKEPFQLGLTMSPVKERKYM